MIRLETTIKATDNAQYNDPQLALQTATAYFLIREIPSSKKHLFTTLPSFLDHPTSDQNSTGGIQGLPKSLLEYLFLAIAVLIIITVIFRRFCWRNRRQRATFQPSASRRYQNFPRQVELQPLHAYGQDAHHDPFLREIPAAHIHPSRRTRGRDIDSSGRRQDIPTETDHDGDLGANDALPAYDYSGGPPKYFELDSLSRSRPPPQSGIVTQRPDASWENINITSPENVGVYTPVDTTHATQVSQHDTSRPTPPYLEHTSSSSNDSLPMTRPRHET